MRIRSSSNFLRPRLGLHSVSLMTSICCVTEGDPFLLDDDQVDDQNLARGHGSWSSMNLPGMKKVVATQAPRPEMARPATKPAAKKPESIKVEPLLKRLKKLGNSLAPTPKPKPNSPPGEGSN
ncbi:hypothetical protein B296_00008728 [Ensete ventricosum]|uniref:Uncharacterized protein n=1 Tax=Ensete ventricosum TaxID=4639 RepID=A0A426YNS4_ENSVE|nr:hypothetical protein B296_00008728 [Ensete ventricosum]